ncbi:MAG: abortive infection family protein [Reyranella sp.]|nr:abortive infection family protein [Reyranella sp.]
MQSVAISEITRRNLFDELRIGNVNWSGRLGESDFLGRVFDLRNLPSNDHRCSNMASDIALHRENFDDWGGIDWVYDDSRLNLLRCLDETFLSFLTEMVHPVVRSTNDEIRQLVEVFNRHLAADRFEIVPRTYISGKPIFAARARVLSVDQGTAPAKKIADEFSSEHIVAQINRMESSAVNDPALAIGTSKEFVETICKGILAERNVTLSGSEDIPGLVRMTRKTLGLSVEKRTEETLQRTLSALATLTQGIAELRGQLGSGHGPHPNAPKATSEVAWLAVRSAIALGVFLYESHRIRPPSG